jgi:hypothetical protein
MSHLPTEGKARRDGRPKALTVQPENIPPDLRAPPRWVVWKYVEEKDPDTGEVDWDKPPLNARGKGPASSTNKATWNPFDVALAAYRRRNLDGIGFVLDGSDDLVGVDLDKCRDPDTGAVEDWALEIVRALDTYTEASPSGRGLRLFLRGQLPPHGRKKGAYENYATGRYVTVTGRHVEGTPRTVEHRQAQLGGVHRKVFGEAPKPRPSNGAGPRTPANLDDAEIIRRAGEAKNGERFKALWAGSTHGYPSGSEADLALVNHLAFWCGPNAEERIDALFRQSSLFRSKWNREDYRERTIRKALDGRTDFYEPGRGKGGNHDRRGRRAPAPAESNSAPWPDPIFLGEEADVPAFPVASLTPWLGRWVAAEAKATQTPPDLAGLLALSICGAALAGKFRVLMRPGWSEPTNLFVVVAMPSAERKSAVFRDAIAPVEEYEREEVRRTAEAIAGAAAEHRIMEARLKAAEARAGKATNPGERMKFSGEAKDVARDLARHVVPEAPQLLVDDVTPEKLAHLLARQAGRILQAAPEGTAFEIAKGRYSETANFDVYLKGHAGDPLRVGRISRDADTVERPALSVALAVQPDVIRGLAEQATMRGRGFLARFLYGLPRSLVGGRQVAPAPVPPEVADAYREKVLTLWKIEGAAEAGGPVPHWLKFSPEADRVMQDFERWLEPRLAEGEELSFLDGWAGKPARRPGRRGRPPLAPARGPRDGRGRRPAGPGLLPSTRQGRLRDDGRRWQDGDGPAGLGEHMPAGRVGCAQCVRCARPPSFLAQGCLQLEPTAVPGRGGRTGPRPGPPGAPQPHPPRARQGPGGAGPSQPHLPRQPDRPGGCSKQAPPCALCALYAAGSRRRGSVAAEKVQAGAAVTARPALNRGESKMVSTFGSQGHQGEAPPAPDPDRQLVERAVRAALEGLDWLADRAVGLQREMMGWTWGRAGPATVTRASAVSVATMNALAALSDMSIRTQEEALRREARAAPPGDGKPGAPAANDDPGAGVWVGWHRAAPRQRWRAVVRAGTQEEALGYLLDRWRGGDKVVLREGEDPNQKRKPR